MENNLYNSFFFRTFEGWIGRSCKPSDKGKLTAFPHFIICQQKYKNVSKMLRFEELPEVNSERWLSLEDLEGEEWRDVVGAEGYYKVSNYGRIKSISSYQKNHYSGFYKKEKIKKLNHNKKGYLLCGMTVCCKKVYPNVVARIVAMAFIPNPQNKPQIDHINTIKTDNRACNLRWVTNIENAYNPITHEKVHRINSRKGVRVVNNETKRKISNKLKGKNNPHYGKRGKDAPRSVPVIQLTLDGNFVMEWENIASALKVYKGHISCCCRGERKSAAGYKWVYKKDYIKT